MAVIESTGFVSKLNGPQSFEGIFLNGMIEVRSGAQPDSADAAPTGTLLGRITRDGGTFTPGSAANGLQFTRNGRFVIKEPTHVWKLVGIATGTAGWCRLVGNAADSGALSLDDPRIDGIVGLIPGVDPTGDDVQLFLPTLSITDTTAIEIGQWYFAKPPL